MPMLAERPMDFDPRRATSSRAFDRYVRACLTAEVRSAAATSLENAIALLGPKAREAYVLFAVSGRSLADVVRETGASVAAVKSRIFGARRDLMVKARQDRLLKSWAG
jgi:DNA-directed RNA polymerase specialized sigma24 family protein